MTQMTNEDYCWCAMQDKECAYAILVAYDPKETKRFFKENAGNEIRKTSVEEARELMSIYIKRYRSKS